MGKLADSNFDDCSDEKPASTPSPREPAMKKDLTKSYAGSEAEEYVSGVEKKMRSLEEDLTSNGAFLESAENRVTELNVRYVIQQPIGQGKQCSKCHKRTSHTRKTCQVRISLFKYQ